MQQTIHFNTRRPYTALGQRITATLHDDETVTFYDHDRGVDGELNSVGAPFDKETVLEYYDRGWWHGSARSMQNALYVGGCNAMYESP